MNVGLKVLQYAVVLMVVLTLNFFLPRFMPGDPLAYLTSDPSVDVPVVLTPEAREELLDYYGLDKPLSAQYRDYLGDVARGDLGWSIYYNDPVSSVLLGRLKWTLLLVGTAALIYVSLGMALGVVSAWKRNSKTDTGLLVSLLSLGSWPSFFLGMLLIIVFSAWLGILPMSGATSRLSGYVGIGAAWDVLRHLILPATTLVLTHMAGVYLLMRNSMLNVLGADYILAARAKGLSERAIMFKHAMPNALLPMITMIALTVSFLIMGTIFVETVFAYPGMGRLIYDAATLRDYPLLQGAFLLLTLIVIVANLVADLVYVRFDPRVRRQ